MNLLRITLAGITGTTFMTLFSYAIAEKRKKQFKEPELLNKLVKRASPNLERINKKHWLGWVMHYTVGFSFATAYDFLWRKTFVAPTMKNSLAMGAISGVLGVLAWKMVFKLHPNPPQTHFEEFYKQLLVAHIIFGLFAKAGYRLPEGAKHLNPSST